MGYSVRNLEKEYGEKETLRVFQEGRIEDRIPSYIKELYSKNRTEGEETKQIYDELQAELGENREANEAWTVVARGKAASMKDVLDASFRLDATFGEVNGIVSREKRGFWRWVRRNWRKIVRVVVTIGSALLQNSRNQYSMG